MSFSRAAWSSTAVSGEPLPLCRLPIFCSEFLDAELYMLFPLSTCKAPVSHVVRTRVVLFCSLPSILLTKLFCRANVLKPLLTSDSPFFSIVGMLWCHCFEIILAKLEMYTSVFRFPPLPVTGTRRRSDRGQLCGFCHSAEGKALWFLVFERRADANGMVCVSGSHDVWCEVF